MNTSYFAVVSGASSGLGKEVTQLLANEGVIVFALARTAQEASFSVDTTSVTNIIPINCNIRDLNSIDAAFAQIDTILQEKNISQENSGSVELSAKISYLINCAGRGLVKKFEDTTREEIMDIFGVNLKGNIYIAQEVYKRMIPHKSGHIINVGSTTSVHARENEVVYATSKWGIRGFTQSLRLEARHYGIRVTGVYPGGMTSENFWKVVPDKDFSEYMNPNTIAKQIVSILHSDATVSPTELVIERP